MLPDYVDNAGYQNPSLSPDLSKTAAQAAAEVSKISKSAYDVVIDNIDLNLFKNYGFVFNYLLTNDDPTDTVLKYGPMSPRFVVTKEEVNAKIPDNTQTPQNVVTTGGLLSYQVKWDKPLWENYVDTIIWEGTSSSFNGSEPVVWTGTGTQANILTSNTNVRYIKIMHRDKFYHAETTSLNKYVISGPITPRDPVVIDASPPANNFTVGAATVLDDPDGLFTFNKKILFTWTANTDTSTYGYQIRFRRLGTTDYTYMSVPGISITSTYLYGVKAGQTYEIGVSTYDQFGNTNTSDWKSYPNIVIPASTSLAADVAITAGDMKMGYGIGGDSANKGLYLGPENYWYIQGNTTSSSAARLSVGGTNDKLIWDGTNLSVTGNLNARGGTFTGNILLSTDNAAIYNGSVTSSGNLIGNGFALNSTGLKVASGANSVILNATDGTITANAGTIAGWSLNGTTFSQNNAELSSTGYIAFGSSIPSNMIKITSQDSGYVMWAGNNNGANAPFSVSKTGVLTATGANITGSVTITGGTAKTAIEKAQSDATSAYDRASTAISNASDAAGAAQTAKDRADYVASVAMLETNINTVLAKNTTIIDGNRITTGTIDVARLNIASGPASSGSYFTVTGSAIQAYKNYTRTLYISSTGDVEMSGKITATTGTIGGWDISSSQISSGGTILSNTGKLTLGVTGDDALTMNAGSNVSMFATGGADGQSYITFYKSGLSGLYWDSRITQSNSGNLVVSGGNYIGGSYANLIANTAAYSGGEVRSYNNGVDQSTLTIARQLPSAAAVTSESSATGRQRMVTFGRRDNLGNYTGAGMISIDASGTAPAFEANSDIRIKKNLEVYDGKQFIKDLKTISPYKFHYKDMPDTAEKRLGFIANDFYENYKDVIGGHPDAVDEDGDVIPMTFIREALIPHMFAAIKYLAAKIEEMENK